MIKVVGPEVVANEGIDGYPHICFDPVSMMPRLCYLNFWLKHEGKNNAGQSCKEADHHISQAAQPLRKASFVKDYSST